MFRWTWSEVSHDDDVHLTNVEDVRLLVAAEADPTEVPTEAADIVEGLAPKSSDAAPDREPPAPPHPLCTIHAIHAIAIHMS